MHWVIFITTGAILKKCAVLTRAGARLIQTIMPQYSTQFYLEQTYLCANFLSFFLSSAAADPLANHEVQAGLQSPFLCWGGGSWSGQRQHGGHRPQTVFCHVRQKREWTERRLHSSWSEGTLPCLRELLTKTTYPRRLWDSWFST